MRSKDYCKFRRGQVWWLNESEEKTQQKIESNSSIQAKSRPYLVVSIDDNNFNSTTLNVVPLSSSADPKFITHVSFKNDKGKLQVIECEQIMTKSIYEFLDYGRYNYTVSDKVMQQVSVKLAHQIGAEFQIPNLDMVISVIERLAKRKAAALQKANQDSLDTAILELGVRLEELFSLTPEVPDSVVVPPKILKRAETSEKVNLDSRTEVISEITANIKDRNKSKSIPKKKTSYKGKHRGNRSYTRWTPEKKLEFIKDSESLTIEELMEKYKMTKSSVMTYVSKFKREQTSSKG